MNREGGRISSIIIDGYNLIGINHGDLEAERDRLIELLIAYGRMKGHRIVVVFDGWKGGGGVESSSLRGGVKVIFSRLGEKADSVIKRILSTERREWIVVSSDREIANHAWATDCVPISSEDFLPFIEDLGAGRPKSDSSADFSNQEKDEDAMESREAGKGNPRKLSRKGKAMNRALGKL